MTRWRAIPRKWRLMAVALPTAMAVDFDTDLFMPQLKEIQADKHSQEKTSTKLTYPTKHKCLCKDERTYGPKGTQGLKIRVIITVLCGKAGRSDVSKMD